MKSKKMVLAFLVPIIMISSLANCGGSMPFGRSWIGQQNKQKLTPIFKPLPLMVKKLETSEKAPQDFSKIDYKGVADVEAALKEIAPQLKRAEELTDAPAIKTVTFEDREWQVDSEGDNNVMGKERSGRYSLSTDNDDNVIQAYIVLRRSTPLRNYIVTIMKDFKATPNDEPITRIEQSSSNTVLANALAAAGATALIGYLYKKELGYWLNKGEMEINHWLKHSAAPIANEIRYWIERGYWDINWRLGYPTEKIKELYDQYMKTR